MAGAIGWPTLLAALGLPGYFTLRRHSGLAGFGALVLELIVFLPFVVWVVFSQPGAFAPMNNAPPTLLLGAILLGIIGGTGLVLYLLASRLLDFTLFGLLGYLELRASSPPRKRP